MSNTIWIWGRHPVLEALRAGTAREVRIASGQAHALILGEIRQEAAERAIPLVEVDSRELQRLAQGQSSQGVAAAIEPRPVMQLSELLDESERLDETPFLLVLDQIQDPHNLGAIVRTADAAGVHGIVLPGRRSAPLSGVVAKTSAGAVHFLRVAEVPNLARGMDKIRERGIWTVGLDSTARTTAFEADLTVPLALIIGGEGIGLRRLTRAHCDLLLRLPMLGHVESLNASVAAGIAIFEAVRQRSPKP